MKVMVIVKATQEIEAQQHPLDIEGGPELFQAMEAYTEELEAAGIVVAGAGLKPSRFGVRIRVEGDERRVIDGPFAEAKELVAGFSIWEVRSIDEAVEWAKRSPLATGSEIEIRPFWEPEDFGPAIAGAAGVQG